MKLKFFDIDNWKEIGTTLARNKTRTTLTAFGIFWGTAMLALLWGGAQGLQSVMRWQFAGFATNVAIVIPGQTSMPYKGYNKGMSWKLSRGDLDKILQRVSQVETLTALDSKSAMTANYNGRHTSTTLQGVESSYVRINEPIIYDGRFINMSDDVNMRKVCVLGKRVATDLFGYKSPVGHDIEINGIYYHVIGVCGQMSEIQIMDRLDESVVIPYSTMRCAYNRGDDIEAVMMLFKREIRASAIQPVIERIIKESHPIHPDDKKAINFFDVSEMFEMVDNLFMGISLLALFVGAGTLLAGVIGVGNIMWVVVNERTQEIGIRRAIGAKPRDIILQILSESIVLTSIAGFAGICFAVLILGVAETVLSQGTLTAEFQIEFGKAVGIMVAFMILGTLAGTIPAVKAMHIKPIEAINDK
ncbi:MAG: ABC transporter permease [Muribaculaceae bacterium]|nr:ABC transporter permease [Muribaculaceae bacterium]